MRKLIIAAGLLLLAVTLSAQKAQTPSAVNMTESNGSLFNTAKLDMIEGKLYLSEFGQREYPYSIYDMQPILNTSIRQSYHVTTKDVYGNITNFKLVIYGKVIERLSQVEGKYSLFTISK